MSATSSLMASPAWPYPTLTRANEPRQKPSRERVLQMVLEANSNLASVTTSTLGVPGFGLLGLTASAEEYQQLTGQVWVRPAQPPAYPVLADNATQFQIAEANCIFMMDWQQYMLMLQTDTTIRNQLLAAHNDVYWRALFQPIVGYGRRTARDFLAHIVEKYAKFDEATRSLVVASMEAPWSGGPFKVVISQIDEGANAFTAAGAALNDQQKCGKLYSIVRNSGLLRSACQKWRLKAAAEKTWANCADHFLRYANDRINDTTALSAGYNSANLAQGAANPITNSLEQATLALNSSIKRFTAMAKQQQESDKVIFKL